MTKRKLIKLLSLSLLLVLSFNIVSCSSKNGENSVVTNKGEETQKEEDKKDEPQKIEPPIVEEEKEEPKKEEPPKVDPPKVNTEVSNTKFGWWFTPNKEEKTPGINKNIGFNLKDYNAIYTGDTERKVLYLTMDEGYENGYTSKILDVLKKNDVKATFFVTSPYIKAQPDLIKRMVNEGHVVGNHSKNHPSMPTVTGDTAKFNTEFQDVEKLYKDLIGQDIPKLFRPPMGEYSEKSLAMTNNLGYKTVFWSFAYNDWDTKNQPDPEYAKKKILDGLHPGAVLLIHAVSKTNTEILEDVIIEARNRGYQFELLPM